MAKGLEPGTDFSLHGARAISSFRNQSAGPAWHEFAEALRSPTEHESPRLDAFARIAERAVTADHWFREVLVERSLIRLKEDLIDTAPFVRLGGVRQMSAFYTVRGSHLTQSRAEHSVDAFQVACVLANKLQLSPRDSVSLAIAALCHDLGHTPFSHTGEAVLKSISQRPQDYGITHLGPLQGQIFDHDLHLHSILRRSELTRAMERSPLLQGLGITPKDISIILAEELGHVLKPNPERCPKIDQENAATTELYHQTRHLKMMVADICDRCAYLVGDMARLRFEFRYTVDAEKIPYDLAEMMYLVRVPAESDPRVMQTMIALHPDAWGASRERLGPVWRMAAHRDMLFRIGGNGNGAVAVNAILGRYIPDLFVRGRCSVGGFMKMNDEQVRNLFDPQVTYWLDRKIERAFEPIAGWHMANLSPEGQLFAESGALERTFTRELRHHSHLGRYAEGVFFCVVPNYSKDISLPCYDPRSGQPPYLRSVTLPCSPDGRMVFVIADRDMDREPGLMSQLRQFVNGFMQRSTVERTPLLSGPHPSVDPHTIFDAAPAHVLGSGANVIPLQPNIRVA